MLDLLITNSSSLANKCSHPLTSSWSWEALPPHSDALLDDKTTLPVFAADSACEKVMVFFISQ